MDVRNCKRCGKIFNYVAGQPICPSCKEEIEHKFQTVKDYIRDNKKAGMTDICEACDVTDKLLKQWIREERLIFGDESPVGIDCEGCGAIIKSGRFCDKCKNDLARDLVSATRKPYEEKEEESPRRGNNDNKMRFLR